MTDLVQKVENKKTDFIYYNLLYFNLTNDKGFECYQEWIDGWRIEEETHCPRMVKIEGESCSNFSRCFDEGISYSIDLS